MHLPLFSKKTSTERFLTILIGVDTVVAGLWSPQGSTIVTENCSTLTPWQPDAPGSLVEAIDVVLEQLGSGAQTAKRVLFGLPSDWANGQSLSSSKKTLLKEISQQLNIQSVGFVVTLEALVAHQRQTEGDMLLCLVNSGSLELMHMTQGMAGTVHTSKRGATLIQDLQETLQAQNTPTLPPKIAFGLLDPSLKTDELQAMFGPVTTATFLSPAQLVAAVSITGGMEVAKSLGLLNPETQGSDAQPPTPFGFAPIAPKTTPPTVPDQSDEKLDLGLSEPPVKNHSVIKMLGMILGGIVILAVVGSGGFLVLLKTASVTIHLQRKPQQLSFTTPLTIDANASQSDPNNNILKAVIKTKTLSDSAQAPTTGTTIIGDKAKGSVILFNLTAATKLFKAGTVLQYSPTIQFTLDNDTTIASRSADNDYAGKATVSVTAKFIGAESNIAKGLELSVAGFDKSAYVAKTDSTMTGGTSRTIQTVSANDQKQLSDSLYQKLKDSAQQSFNAEVAQGEHVMVSDQLQVASKQFSDNPGSETKSFTLTMSVNATGIVYTNTDVADFAREKLSGQLPPGAVITPDNTTIDVTDQQPGGDQKTQVTATISVKIQPAIDTTQLGKLLTGKTMSEATDFLSKQTSISSASISVAPSFLRTVLTHIPSGKQTHFVIE